MKLSDYLSPDGVVILEATTKAEALRELITVMANCGPGTDRGELERAIFRREEVMSTGIGLGLAIPHVRLPGLKAAGIAVGVSREGISDYESLDGRPVHVVVLIQAPSGEHETYIRLLAKVADVLKQEVLRESVIAAEDPAEICRILGGGNA